MVGMAAWRVSLVALVRMGWEAVDEVEMGWEAVDEVELGGEVMHGVELGGEEVKRWASVLGGLEMGMRVLKAVGMEVGMAGNPGTA